jgi:hypothetical protein
MNPPDPVRALLQIAGGYCLSRCLHVVADLGVADALDGRPRTAAELAAAVGADPDALGRALRLLAAHGVFQCDGDRIEHSEGSRLLRSDHPHSLRSFARMFGLPIFWTSSGALDHAIGTGRPAAEMGYRGGFWAYLADHPEASAIFNAAMQGKAHGQVASVVEACQFTEYRRIGDIGGGRGHLLRAVLDATPNATGVLFDLPHVVAEVAVDESKRLTVQGGDFFKDALPSCDLYLLMEVIHDWGDEESVGILRAIRRAALPRARLLLIEQIVPDDSGPDWTKTLDIQMMALFGGRQRTRPEYQSLLDQAGFSLERVIETPVGISILEASPSAGRHED